MADGVFGSDFDDDDDDGGRRQASGLTGKRALLFIGLPILIIVLIGLGAAIYLFSDEILPKKASYQADEMLVSETTSEEKATAEYAVSQEYFDLPPILVNLRAVGDRKPHFLKMKVTLELGRAEDKQRVKNQQPRILDSVQVYLRELTIDQLQGSAGIYRLREELKVRISEAVKPARIRGVLFQELLVQ